VAGIGLGELLVPSAWVNERFTAATEAATDTKGANIGVVWVTLLRVLQQLVVEGVDLLAADNRLNLRRLAPDAAVDIANASVAAGIVERDAAGVGLALVLAGARAAANLGAPNAAVVARAVVAAVRSRKRVSTRVALAVVAAALWRGVRSAASTITGSALATASEGEREQRRAQNEVMTYPVRVTPVASPHAAVTMARLRPPVARAEALPRLSPVARVLASGPRGAFRTPYARLATADRRYQTRSGPCSVDNSGATSSPRQSCWRSNTF